MEGGGEEAEEEGGGQSDEHPDEDGGGEEDEGAQPSVVVDGVLLGLDVVVEGRFEEEDAQGLWEGRNGGRKGQESGQGGSDAQESVRVV